MSRFFMIVLIVLGILAIAAGIIYYAEPAKSLPSFFPGHGHTAGKHTLRGIGGIVVGAVLVIVGVIVGRTGRRVRY